MRAYVCVSMRASLSVHVYDCFVVCVCMFVGICVYTFMYAHVRFGASICMLKREKEF